MTVLFLVSKLKGNGKENNDNVNIPLSVEDTNSIVYELWGLAKTN